MDILISVCILLFIIFFIYAMLNLIWNKCFRKYDIYLSGPMRGLQDDNRQLFGDVANTLRDAGYTVYNPPEHNPNGKLSFDCCIRKDLYTVINRCKKIILLPGWRDSEGVSVELVCALNCSIPVAEIFQTADGEWLCDKNFDSTSIDMKPFRSR